jgi:hypothetical protein
MNVAEYVAVETVGLKLAPLLATGYDVLPDAELIQIRGRAQGKMTSSGHEMGHIKTDCPSDSVLLVVLDNAALEPREMWEAAFGSVIGCLGRSGSKARPQGVLSFPEFTRTARRVSLAEAFHKGSFAPPRGKLPKTR